MKKYNMMKNNVLILVSLIFLIGCKKSEQKVISRVETLPFYDDPTFTPKWFAKDNDSLKSFHKIADFSLINQEGDTITNKTFLNKIYGPAGIDIGAETPQEIAVSVIAEITSILKEKKNIHLRDSKIKKSFV